MEEQASISSVRWSVIEFQKSRKTQLDSIIVNKTWSTLLVCQQRHPWTTMATQLQPAELLIAAGVPAYKCPKGTKMHILDLGKVEIDEGW
ncbi:hypothetical protein ES702_02401 [subsurface metagenome]